MRIYIFIAMLALLLVGCSDPEGIYVSKGQPLSSATDNSWEKRHLRSALMDGHLFAIYDEFMGGGITHHPNCEACQ